MGITYPLWDEEDALRIMRETEQIVRDFADVTIILPSDDGVVGIGQTVSGGNYPAVANAVYLLTPLGVDCDDTEGAAGSYTNEAGTVPALNIGTGSPPQGTRVLYVSVGGRWIFRWNG